MGLMHIRSLHIEFYDDMVLIKGRDKETHKHVEVPMTLRNYRLWLGGISLNHLDEELNENQRNFLNKGIWNVN